MHTTCVFASLAINGHSKHQSKITIHIEKWLQMMYNYCMFAGLAISGHSDHETDKQISPSKPFLKHIYQLFFKYII